MGWKADEPKNPIPVPPPAPGAPTPPPPAPGTPPPPPMPSQAEAMRAAFEQESAYRDLRRGAVMLQQIEGRGEAGAFAAQIYELASQVYRAAHEARQRGEAYRAAELFIAVKDMMRALDKMYHVEAV